MNDLGTILFTLVGSLTFCGMLCIFIDMIYNTKNKIRERSIKQLLTAQSVITDEDEASVILDATDSNEQIVSHIQLFENMGEPIEG
jgi:hypothetical protein